MLKSNCCRGAALIAMFLILAAIYARAEERTAGAPAPVIKITAARFDAGKVKEGAVLAHDFVIVNAGNALLKIQDLVPA